jgi:hypothetical protein
MLGYIGLADLEGFLEVAHTLDALNEVFKDLYPDWMGNDFEQVMAFVNGNHEWHLQNNICKYYYIFMEMSMYNSNLRGGSRKTAGRRLRLNRKILIQNTLSIIEVHPFLPSSPRGRG